MWLGQDDKKLPHQMIHQTSILLCIHILSFLLASQHGRNTRSAYMIEALYPAGRDKVEELADLVRRLDTSETSSDYRNILMEKAVEYDSVEVVSMLQPKDWFNIMTRAHVHDAAKVFLLAHGFIENRNLATASISISITMCRRKIFRELLAEKSFDFSPVVVNLLNAISPQASRQKITRIVVEALRRIVECRPEILEILRKQEATLKYHLQYGNSELAMFLAKFTSKSFPLDLIKTGSMVTIKAVCDCFLQGDLNTEGFFVDVKENRIETYLEASISHPDSNVFIYLYELVVSSAIAVAPKHPGKPLASQFEIACHIGQMFENGNIDGEALIRLIHDRRIPFSIRGRAFESNNSCRALACLYKSIAEIILTEISSKERFDTGLVWIPKEIAKSILDSEFAY